MKKSFVILGITLALLMCGLDKALAESKFAVVDVQAVVNNSSRVEKLKADQAKQSKELAKWVENARADVAKQKTDDAKDKLTKKYDNELNKKREANAKAYAKSLTEIDASITNTINTYAKNNGYDMVFSKNVVLYGGNDITAEISKIVK